MTPREALYHLVIELGPVPTSTRDDNLSPKEIRLRDAVGTLQSCVRRLEQLDIAESDDYIAKDRVDLMQYYCAEASKH